MPAIRNITRMIDRSRQGTTRPWLCECDDGNTYYVKGVADGYDGQIAEWVAGTLGRQFGLPIPEFCQVAVDEALVNSDLSGELTELGAGIRFGSRVVESAQEFHPNLLSLVPSDLRAKVLLWDRWIANGDRWAAQKKRNVNLLWTSHNRQLHVFDHNLAFDREPPQLRNRHIFRDDVFNWTLDFRMEMAERMDMTIAALPTVWETMPDEWRAQAINVTLEHVADTLNQFQRNPSTFWTL